MIQDPPQTSEPLPAAEAQDGAPADAAPTGAAEAAAPAASAREAELEAELAKLKNDVLYARAETENVRRRLEQQAEDRGKYAVAAFAKDVLQVADNLRRALDSIPDEAKETDPTTHKLAEGVELTERALLATFERYGITRIESVGQRFDPNLHQAMMEVEALDQPAGTVVLEMQAGYTIHGRLLREAMVGVAKGGPKPAPGAAGVDTTV
jgi:molecular chaperone GrpE